MSDDVGAPASPSGSRATHEAPSGLHPSGFDPSRCIFPRERLLYAVNALSALAATKARNIAYGAWNPLNMASDASEEATAFFDELRTNLEHYAHQAAIAMEARRAETQGGSVADDSAGRQASPGEWR